MALMRISTSSWGGSQRPRWHVRTIVSILGLSNIANEIERKSEYCRLNIARVSCHSMEIRICFADKTVKENTSRRVNHGWSFCAGCGSSEQIPGENEVTECW